MQAHNNLCKRQANKGTLPDPRGYTKLYVGGSSLACVFGLAFDLKYTLSLYLQLDRLLMISSLFPHTWQ